ncbi:LOW QUALITY PROTEIN: uncharacterized protein ACDL77_022560 [Rhynchocyon petersi]
MSSSRKDFRSRFSTLQLKSRPKKNMSSSLRLFRCNQSQIAIEASRIERASHEVYLTSPAVTGKLNTSFGEGFILVGFSDWPQLELALFVIISIFYSLTLFGNTTIIILSHLDVQLHTPMYFFLCHLSFLDLCYTTSTVPQLLINLHGSDNTITYGGCVAQLFISLALGSTECVLLVVMAFDRYAAVCRPLHYMTIMHPFLCQTLAAISWIGGFMNSVVQTGLMMSMPLCGHHHLNHFCEMPVFLKLACEDTQGTEVKMFVARVIILVVPAALILGSYIHIAQAVLRVNSTAGRRKAFGTCGSHLLVVFLFYGSAIYTYLQPTRSYSQSEGKFVALFYTIITPMLNPVIYTLRNKDMKGALRKVVWKERDLENYLYTSIAEVQDDDIVGTEPSMKIEVVQFEVPENDPVVMQKLAAEDDPLQTLAAISWIGGFMNSVVQTGLMMSMPLCGHHHLNHFFCEMPVFLKLACEDTQGMEVKMFVARVIILVVPAALILGSYVHIAQAPSLHSANTPVLSTQVGIHIAGLTVPRQQWIVKFSDNKQSVITEVIHKLMGRENFTSGGFILVGFSEQPWLQRILFVFILIFYLLTLMGNGTIVLVSQLDSQLHIPMYFFLTHLSFIDLIHVTCISPQMLVNLEGADKSISFVGCVVQLFITLGLGSTECILLAMMAYDRYVAVCQPLHYSTVMPPQLCWALAGTSWFIGFSNSLIQTPITMTLPRCGHYRINHFYCEMPPVMQLVCVDTSNYKKEVAVVSSVFLLFPLSLILVSYGYISHTVLRMKSPGGRKKALGTCGSHLTVVSIFYSTLIYIYVIPKPKLSHDVTKFVALLYNLIPPVINPIIYTLRNRDVKEAIRKLVMGKQKRGND